MWWWVDVPFHQKKCFCIFRVFLASPRCFSGVSDFYAATQSISRDMGFWERFLFLPRKSPWWNGGETYTLKVALNILKQPGFQDMYVSSRVRGYMIYIYIYILIHLVYIIFLCCHCVRNVWTFKGKFMGVEGECLWFASRPSICAASQERRTNHRNKWPTSWASWWFQPLWKILVKLDHLPK